MTPSDPDTPSETIEPTRLGRAGKGFRGVVVHVGGGSGHSSVDAVELERRLLEIGFVEGAAVEVLEVGLIGGDPMALKLDDVRVAVRRREADAVLVRPFAPRR
jgi:ferrous iron transport protein A